MMSRTAFGAEKHGGNLQRTRLHAHGLRGQQGQGQQHGLISDQCGVISLLLGIFLLLALALALAQVGLSSSAFLLLTSFAVQSRSSLSEIEHSAYSASAEMNALSHQFNNLSIRQTPL